MIVLLEAVVLVMHALMKMYHLVARAVQVVQAYVMQVVNA